jgi:predicted thioesterase
MKPGLKIGSTGTLTFRVEPAHGIAFSGNGMPAVLSTPWLIWFLEHAAREALKAFIEPGEATVGAHIDVDHLAPTPMGQTVTCLARVIGIEGRTISFQLEAHDESDLIARGFHRRSLIDVQRFSRRVERKTRRA